MLRLAEVMERAIVPALRVLPRCMDSKEARLLLLAIGLQESRFEYRRQLGGGPARGFFQFEEGTRESRGGVWGAYLHPASNEYLRLLSHERDCEFTPRSIYHRIEHDDVLAAGVARLLLWTDPKPLPAIGERQKAWDYYKRTWNPGKPKPRSWNSYYQCATREIQPEPKGLTP